MSAGSAFLFRLIPPGPSSRARLPESADSGSSVRRVFLGGRKPKLNCSMLSMLAGCCTSLLSANVDARDQPPLRKKTRGQRRPRCHLRRLDQGRKRRHNFSADEMKPIVEMSKR